MPTSLRLDDETEALPVKTAKALNTSKSEVLKASIQHFCGRTLAEKGKNPYRLVSDPIGKEYSGKGNLAMATKKSYGKPSGKGNDSPRYRHMKRSSRWIIRISVISSCQ